MIAARKFYATLPHKLDAAQIEWLDAQPDLEKAIEFSEKIDGETLLGGEMRLTFKTENNTTT